MSFSFFSKDSLSSMFLSSTLFVAKRRHFGCLGRRGRRWAPFWRFLFLSMTALRRKWSALFAGDIFIIDEPAGRTVALPITHAAAALWCVRYRISLPSLWYYGARREKPLSRHGTSYIIFIYIFSSGTIQANDDDISPDLFTLEPFLALLPLLFRHGYHDGLAIIINIISFFYDEIFADAWAYSYFCATPLSKAYRAVW